MTYPELLEKSPNLHLPNPKTRSINSFLDHCTMCGGNWAAMFMSGIKEVFPDVWEALPNDDIEGFAIMALVGDLVLIPNPETGEFE